MTEITPLTVTLEMSAKEFMDHEGGLLVRCPLNGMWVPLFDYYSEKEGSLLPLVGNVDYQEAPEHWVDSGEFEKNDKGEPRLDQFGNVIKIMMKEAKPDTIHWVETVRVLEKVEEAPPEGGTLEFQVHDAVGTQDKFGR